MAIAIAAQWMDRSVLDAGLAVLSFASGSVLGAFLMGTIMSGISERDALTGMVAGLIVMTIVWRFTTIAFTWYVFIGAVTTCLVAWVLSKVMPPPRHTPAVSRELAA